MTKEPQEETYQTLENKALEEFEDYFQVEYIDTGKKFHMFNNAEKKLIKDFLKSHLQLAYKSGKESSTKIEGIEISFPAIEKLAITNERERIGEEFREWFHAGNISEPIEDAIERITKVKC